MSEPFSAKLTLVLKALSMSRAQLASALGIDKSVVARWASGATTPSAHNLAQLSALLARTVPGFTALDWDLDLAGLAGRLGVTRPAAGPAAPPGLSLPFMDQILATTALRAGAYEGFYRSTRPYAAHPGRFIHDHLMVRREADGLLHYQTVTGGVWVRGWLLPVQNQLFAFGTEFTGGALAFAILHGVNTVSADRLDGILLSANHDGGRTPASCRVIYQRIGALSGDRDADQARLEALGQPNPVAPDGSVPEDIVRHLTCAGEATADWDWVLRLPLAESLSRGPETALP